MGANIGQAMEKLKEVWRKIVAFHNSRMITSVMRMSQEDFNINIDESFNRAKRLTDFVGILIRWSFVQFAGYYFLESSSSADHWFEKYAFQYCGIGAFGVAVYFSIRIFSIIFLYWASDAAHHESKVRKYIIAAMALSMTLAFWFGISRMIRDLAKASQLLGGNP
jgi:Rad3-related DNA helicase